MRKVIFFLVLVFLLMENCNNPSRNASSTINPDLNGHFVKISEFVNEISLVPLETSSVCLIGEISKVMFSENRIYILDRVVSSVLIFDRSGKYITKIHQVGHGPNEYINAIDFDIVNDEIFLLDYTGRKVIQYDQQQKYLRDFSIPFYASQLCVMSSGFLFKCEPMNKSGDPYFVLTRENGKIIRTIDEIAEQGKFNFGGIPTFARYQDVVFFSKTLNNSIFCIQNNKIIEKFYLNFGEYNVPPNIKLNDINIFDKTFKYVVKYNFWIAGKWLIINYFKDMKSNYIWVELPTGVLYSGKMENDLNDLAFFPKWTFGNGLIGAIDAYEITKPEFKRNCWPELDHVNPTDNPIIVIYNIKK